MDKIKNISGRGRNVADQVKSWYLIEAAIPSFHRTPKGLLFSARNLEHVDLWRNFKWFYLILFRYISPPFLHFSVWISFSIAFCPNNLFVQTRHHKMFRDNYTVPGLQNLYLGRYQLTYFAYIDKLMSWKNR